VGHEGHSSGPSHAGEGPWEGGRGGAGDSLGADETQLAAVMC